MTQEDPTMKVDLDQLEEFAGKLRGISPNIANIDPMEAWSEAQTALHGTEFPDVCDRAGDVTKAALQRIAARLDAVAAVADESKNHYGNTNQHFADSLNALDPQNGTGAAS